MAQPGGRSDGQELEEIEEGYGCQKLALEKRMNRVPDGVSKEGMEVYRPFDTDFHHSDDTVVVEPFHETNNTMCLVFPLRGTTHAEDTGWADMGCTRGEMAEIAVSTCIEDFPLLGNMKNDQSPCMIAREKCAPCSSEGGERDTSSHQKGWYQTSTCLNWHHCLGDEGNGIGKPWAGSSTACHAVPYSNRGLQRDDTHECRHMEDSALLPLEAELAPCIDQKSRYSESSPTSAHSVDSVLNKRNRHSVGL